MDPDVHVSVRPTAPDAKTGSSQHDPRCTHHASGGLCMSDARSRHVTQRAALEILELLRPAGGFRVDLQQLQPGGVGALPVLPADGDARQGAQRREMPWLALQGLLDVAY